jgi:RNA polymerase sigma-70 factor, ECF subfamily
VDIPETKTESVTSITETKTYASDADIALVYRVQEGDVSAYNILIQKYEKRLYSVIYNLTSNREDASDLTQEAFIKAFRSISNFKGKSSFFTWLYRIAVNNTISTLKKNRYKQFFSLESIRNDINENKTLNSLIERNSADKPTFLKELQEKLNEALQKLSINHRTIVVLHEIEGLSHQEIANITKTSEGTVRSRLHYAKQQLQGFLKDYVE